MRVIEGNNEPPEGKVGVVVSRFNEFISKRLLAGCCQALGEAGVELETGVTVAWVPGAFEIPLVAKRMAESGEYRTVVTLGCVIRGGTPHFDYVCNEVSRGVSEVSMAGDVPVIFGVLTTDTFEQAEARSAVDNNKGADCARAALQMVSLLQQLGE